VRYLLIVLAIFVLPVQAENIAGSFSTAKKWAEESVYHDRRISFYCGCSYSEGKEVNQKSCGYSPRKPLTSSGKENTRDNRIEWEHVLPASLMGGHLSCWGSERGQFSQCVKSNGSLRSGRECCQKVNDTFRKAHNDLVNLTPAIGEVNGDRSNHRYGIVDNEPREYGACDFEFENNVAEPAVRIRGDIARIQLYINGS
jgi:deoxyribonuclease-1